MDVDFLVDGQVETRNIPVTMLPATKAYKFFKKLTSVDGGLSNFTEDEVKDLVITSTQIKPEKFDIQFAGNMVALMTLAAKIVNYNFEDVFTALDSEEKQQVE